VARGIRVNKVPGKMEIRVNRQIPGADQQHHRHSEQRGRRRGGGGGISGKLIALILNGAAGAAAGTAVAQTREALRQQ
jgi:hypothetical protein